MEVMGSLDIATVARAFKPVALLEAAGNFIE
jgi:hypothetical protein